MPSPEKRNAVICIHSRSPLSEVGNKAMNTQLMMRLGLRVPRSWAIPFWLGVLYREDRGRALALLSAALADALPASGTFAVRSSAEGEDDGHRSFAGQFSSVLDVPRQEVVEAVEKVWLSLKGPTLEQYSVTPAKMGVLVQMMVTPDISGVAFSCDPINGRRVAIVEAVKGMGGRLVQDGVSPWRHEMTRNMVQLAEDVGLQRKLLCEVVSTTFWLRDRLGRELDLEWVYDGRRLFWVQLRNLTGLRPMDRYTNTFSQEFLPGMIKPLVWSVNVPINSRAWVRLLVELTGRKDLDADRLAKSFYYRAYFNMGEFGKLWEAMGMPDDLLERMVLMRGKEKMSFQPSPKLILSSLLVFRFLWSKRRWFFEIDEVLCRLGTDHDARTEEDLTRLSDEELLSRVDSLLSSSVESAYYTVLCLISSSMVSRIWKKYLERRGLDWQRLSLRTSGDGGYPEDQLENLRALVDDEVRMLGLDLLRTDPCHQELVEAFDAFLLKFGHYSESGNDFSVAPWRETPELVWDIVRTRSEKKRMGNIEARGLLLSGLQRQEAKFRSYRERMGSMYTRYYSLFRGYFLEMGERLASRNLLERREHIFLLDLREAREALLGPLADYKEMVAARESEMERLSDIDLPQVIYGEEPPPVRLEGLSVLKGTPSSGGYYRGKATVVRCLADMKKMRPGDVLVIPYSDVGWTPFFHLAGAVVSESGGMLSHSSIIAREYGIPAVVSVPGAMRIKNDDVLEIDGYRGEVVVVPPS